MKKARRLVLAMAVAGFSVMSFATVVLAGGGGGP